MPILLWPFPSGVVPPPPFIPRETTGKVFTIDAVNRNFFGPGPYVKEPCTLVFNVGPGVPEGEPVQFYFISPDGVIQAGDPIYAFATPVIIQEKFPFSGFPARQALIYTFAFGELELPGRWSVYAVVGGFQSATVSFTVIPAPGPSFQFIQT